MTKVSNHTRAGSSGKSIYCPVCSTEATVFHFAWSALTCEGCGESINKQDYFLHKPNETVSVTMSTRTWTGLLYHLQDTVNTIPISCIEPDPYQCVNISIAKIRDKLHNTDGQDD
jgi:ribosomal protein S27E